MHCFDPITRKAQKEHKCTGCLGVIHKGSEYETYGLADEGTIYTVKLCGKCVYVAENFLGGEAFNEGELLIEHGDIPLDAMLLT